MRKVLIALLTLLMVGGFVFAQDPEGDTSGDGQGGTAPSKTITLKTSVEGDSDFVLDFAVVPNTHEEGQGAPSNHPGEWKDSWNSVDNVGELYLDITGKTDSIDGNDTCDSFFIVIGAKGNNLSEKVVKTVKFTFTNPVHQSFDNEVVALTKAFKDAVDESAFGNEKGVTVDFDNNDTFTITHPAGQLTQKDKTTVLGSVLVTWEQNEEKTAGKYNDGSVVIEISTTS